MSKRGREIILSTMLSVKTRASQAFHTNRMNKAVEDVIDVKTKKVLGKSVFSNFCGEIA
jgi:hypothetical protein